MAEREPSNEHRELLRLVGALCSGVSTPDEVEELNRRLASDQQARNDYRDYLQVHLVMVEQARKEAGSSDDPSTADPGARLAEATRPPIAEQDGVAVEQRRAGRSVRAWGLAEALNSPLMTLTAAAAVLLAVAWGVSTYRDRPRQAPQLEFAQATRDRDEAGLLDASDDEQMLVVRYSQALRRVSQLTRTASLHSLQLPQTHLEGASGLILSSGVAWMDRGFGQKERGYVVALPPEHALEMYVDANAAGQNSLSVIELDDRGDIAGGAVSFNNLSEGAVVKKLATSLGNYLNVNHDRTTKYFLLTGSYNDPEKQADDTWSQSDYQVQSDTDDMLVLGFDDSRYVVSREEDREQLSYDRDYNDIRAIIRIAGPEEPAAPPRNQVVFTPEPLADAEPLADDRPSGYAFDVKPGEVLALVVSTAASTPTRIEISEAPSRAVVWRQEIEAPTVDEGSLRTRHDVYVIRNFSGETRRYALHGQHPPATAEAADWVEWEPQELSDGEGSVTLGFKDASEDSATVDWHGVSVHAQWFGD